MNDRYSTDTTDAKRLQLNEAYSGHLYKLVDKYPEDIDIKALYVDVVMLQHAWDFWETDGIAKAWTVRLVSLCDDILTVSPAHPAALHYQVHLVEASMHPEKALANAALLRTTLPGVSHMVHMSTHMYQRNGLYYEGVEVNTASAGLQVYYDSMVPNLKLGLGALTHFDAVGSFCAMQVNMYKQAIQSSGRLHNMLVTTYSQRLSNTFLQYLLSMQMFVKVRSGEWKEVINEPEQAQELHYARLLQYFGKGMAYLHLNDTAAAGECLMKLRDLLGDNSLKARNM